MIHPAYGEMFHNGVQTVWNSHSIMAAEKCLRYYQYTIVEGWQKPEGSVHLAFGSAIASALRAYYVLRHEGAAREEAIREVVRLALIESKGWTFEHHLKNRYTLIRTIVWYFEEFRDDLKVVQIDGRPAVEQLLTVEVDDGNTFVGQLDRAVHYGEHLFVMDQKTTGSTISPYWFKQWKPSTQMSMYNFLGKIALALPVEGVIIDGMQIAVGFSRFARDTTYRTEAELEEWYDSALYHIMAAQAATQSNHFPMNTSSCNNFGGCVFREVCSRSPEVRPQFLKSDFERAEAL